MGMVANSVEQVLLDKAPWLKDLMPERKLLELEHRVHLSWQQDLQPTPDLRWLIDIDWPSDDRIRSDFYYRVLGIVFENGDDIREFVASFNQPMP